MLLWSSEDECIKGAAAIATQEIRYVPIGIIHSPFKDIKGMPIQPTGARGIAGTIEIDSEYVKGLKDIKDFRILS